MQITHYNSTFAETQRCKAEIDEDTVRGRLQINSANNKPFTIKFYNTKTKKIEEHKITNWITLENKK